MTTSRYNRTRRRKIRRERDAAKRRMRRTGGDWKSWERRRPRPNQLWTDENGDIILDTRRKI